MSSFADKILLLHHDLPPNFDTIHELEPPRLSLDSTFDTFSQPSWTDRILNATKTTTWPLNPCSSCLVKASIEEARGPLVDIINLSFETGVFPLREAVVVLPSKKPTLELCYPANYLPVSNLLFLGKVLERAAAEQFQKFLHDTSALDPFQVSFHPGHGT